MLFHTDDPHADIGDYRWQMHTEHFPPYQMANFSSNVHAYEDISVNSSRIEPFHR